MKIMVNKTIFKKGRILLLLSMLLMLLQWFSLDASRVFNSYTRGVYPTIKWLLGKIASITDIAYGEILVGLLLIVGIIVIVKRMRHFFRCLRMDGIQAIILFIVSDLLTVMIGLITTLIVFQGIWGLNYHQLSLQSQLSLERQVVQSDELASLLVDLSAALDIERQGLSKNRSDVVITSASHAQLFQQAYVDYTQASLIYEFVELPSSPPKEIASSVLFSYSGISGIYNPFTGEANVNVLNSAYMLPVVALHEMAHQQGIAREDEANFVAYLISQKSDAPLTRYSGKLLVLIHGLNNLRRIDPIRHRELYEILSEGILNDLRAHSELWATYDGPFEETHKKINDQYLKANGQESGVESYSQMIELYVAWMKNNR